MYPADGTPIKKLGRGTGVKLQTTSNGAPWPGALRRKAMTLMSALSKIQPFEAVGRKVDPVQGRFAAVHAVQIAHQMLYAGMLRQLRNPPLELAIVRPFAPLPEFAAHEQ